MRRFSTLALSLLTVLLGLTAWAQTQREAAKAPRATGDVQLISANPASGSTVAEVSGIMLTWSVDINVVNEDSYNVGSVLNEDGEVVAIVNADMWVGGYKTCMVNAKPTDPAVTGIDAPGTYTVVIDADMFGEDPWGYGADPSVTNDKIELTYIIAGGGGSSEDATQPQMVSVSPSAPVETLSAIEVKFDQPVDLSLAAGDMIIGVYEQSDMWTNVAKASVAMKAGDNTSIVFTLDNPISTPGTYCVDVVPELVLSAGTDLGNDYFVVSATVSGSGSGTGDDQNYAKFDLTYPTSDELEGDSFTMLNFAVENGSKIDDSITLFLVDENGARYALTATIFNGTTVIVSSEEDITTSGTYTLDVPAGFITNAKGQKNAAFSKTWTYTNPNGGLIDDDRTLEFEYAKLVNKATGEELNLLDPKTEVPVLGEGWTLKVLPNIFDVAQEINLIVSHYGIDEYGNEGIVTDRRFEMWEGDGYKKDDCFEMDIMGNTKLEKGTTYTLTFNAENTHIAPDLRHDWGTVETTVQGGSDAYKYSEAQLVSVFPEEGAEIYNPNQVFRLTFSEPVDIEVSMNEGMGASSPLHTAMPANEERTEWTFTFPAGALEREKAYVNAIIAAKDEKGLVVKGNSATEDKSVFSISWDCHLGCPRVAITPETGVVESIFSFTAVAENGGAIALGSGLDKPYLTTASGARVAEVDMDSEVKYNAAGVDMSTLGASDEISVKVTFNLDKEITAPGKYILTVPFGAFALGTRFDSSSNRPMQIEYIIDGTPEYDRVSIADGAEVSELSFVVVYANADVDFALVAEEDETGEVLSETRKANMILRTSQGVQKTVELIKTMNNGVTMLIADFMEDGKPYRLESGVDYTLTISKNSVFLAGTDIAFPILNVNVKGASAEGATVALSQEIAGLYTSVADVAKGSYVAVTFAPAEGWKVGSVEFNGSDVTASVKDNVYTTPALDADSELVASYEYDGTLFTPSVGAELITDFKLRVYSENSEIVLENLTKGMLVNVFTVDGAFAGSYDVDDMDVLRVSVPSAIYVVTVTLDGKTQAVKINNK